jgi:hypothetical protein
MNLRDADIFSDDYGEEESTEYEWAIEEPL